MHKYEKIPIGNAEDLTGQKFGKWYVLFRTKSSTTTTKWVCKCDCGTIKVVSAQNLKNTYRLHVDV